MLIVTNADFRAKIIEQIKSFRIPSSNILLEPEGKNTAPAIAWAAAHVKQIDKNAVMAVLPSDHLILNARAFLKVLDSAVHLANQNYLVTLGIVPGRLEIGYGYLKTERIAKSDGPILKVVKFTEKPTLKKAEMFLKEKKYYWNSGMFIWKVDVILNEFKKYLPVIYNVFHQSTQARHIKQNWSKLPNISIDYGILEKSDNVVMVPGKNIGWTDLGSWEALSEILVKDKEGNFLKGDCLSLNCQDTFVWGKTRFIAAVGLKDVVIIDTPDALLISHKSKSQRVKEVVDYLVKTRRKNM